MQEQQKRLHPKIEEFKAFVKAHPKLANEVRANKRTWKNIYEDWLILGEEDEIWDSYKAEAGQIIKKKKENSESQKDFIGQFLNIIKNVDMNELQGQIENVNGAISNIQSLIQQFQSFKQPNQEKQPVYQDPFSFRKH